MVYEKRKVEFGQIRFRTAELASLERLKKSPQTHNGRKVVNTLAPSFFAWIVFILAGNKDMHKSLDEFEFQADPTTDYGVTCP